MGTLVTVIFTILCASVTAAWGALLMWGITRLFIS